MAQSLVGWKLLDADGNEVNSWGGTLGQYPGLPNPLPLPSGMAQVAAAEVGSDYVDFDGAVYHVVEWFKDVPDPLPADYKLTKRQIKRALIISGTSLDPEAFVAAIIAKIPDATMRAVALADWQDAPYYDRSNALFNDPALLAAAGMTSQQIDALWMLAKDQPA